MIHPIISNLVGERHVGESNLKVIRYVLSRLFRRGLWSIQPKWKRREILRQIIDQHQTNRALYRRVMRGGF